jgi:hypothetical protein
MHWFVLPLVLIWIVFCLVFGLISRRLLWPARSILIIGFLGSFVAVGYGVTEFIVNKGPDDWGSMWHAGYPLSAKYGPFQSASYTMTSFDKDPNGSGSGAYRVRFEYNGQSGTVLCHYDKATDKFDHDEIVPDK